MGMSDIDFTKESPIKMLAPLRIKPGRSLQGRNIPKSMGGLWQIIERADISNDGGYATLTRIMTSNPENEPIGEEFTLAYGMVCSAMEQLRIKPIN